MNDVVLDRVISGLILVMPSTRLCLLEDLRHELA